MIEDRRGRLKSVFKELESQATKRHCKVHDSFFVELDNYSVHRVVEDLPESDMRKVIREIGKQAIVKAPGKVGGGHIREVLRDLCPDPFKSCDDASRVILTDDSSEGL